MNYAETCQAYAEGQGLKPMMDALTEKSIEWDLWQSGGFCMVLIVKQDSSVDGYLGDWGITWGGPDDGWIVCWYQGGTDEEQPNDQPTYFLPTTDDVLYIVTPEEMR